MVNVEDDRRWWLRVTRNKLVHKRSREAREIGAGHTGFEPGEGRGACQVLGRLKRDAFDAQLEQGVMPQAIGIIAVRIPRSDLIEALREEIAERMIDIGGVTLVADSSGQAFCEPDLPVNPA